MFENVDGRTTDGRTTDARVTGILIAHLGAFGSGELKSMCLSFRSLKISFYYKNISASSCESSSYHMISSLRVIKCHVLYSINHKWFTYLVMLCNDFHNKVAYIMLFQRKCNISII